MEETHKHNNPLSFDDGIDLLELFHILLNGKWIIISVTAFASIIGVIYSLNLPNIYESRTLLTPANSSGSISNALRGYSGITGIAGLSLPIDGDKNNSKKAIAKISSLSFFENEILPNIFIPDLLALKSWNPKTNSLIYDDSIFIKSSNTWIRDSSKAQKKIPTPQESFRAFKSHLNISEDNNTGFVTISIKHESPYIAKEWVELLVGEINSFYRQKDKIKSEKALSYLNQKIASTNLSEIKQSIADLLKQETQKLTLIEANEFYVFDYIDSPAVMEKKSQPNRARICILFFLMGGMLSVLILLIKHFFFKEKFA